MEELLEIGHKAVKHAERLGVDEAEVFLSRENFASVKFVGGIFASRGGAVKGIKGSFARLAEFWIKKKGLPIITGGTKAGVGVRAIVKKAIGFASVSSLEEKRVFEVVEEAAKIARIRPQDSNWKSLPEPKKPKGRSGKFDERIAHFDIEEALELCSDCCVSAADFDKRITWAMIALSAAATTFAVVNTRNVEVGDKGTFFTTYFGTKAKSKSEEASGGNMLFSRTYIENLEDLAINAARRAIENLGSKALPEKHVGPVVFENIGWNQLLSAIFTSNISALEVQENRSPYNKKLGKQVAVEDVCVVDDGTLPEGLSTSIIDDEGTPKQKTTIIENGVLQSFLYDNYAAKRERLESTGNGSRQRPASASYANQPSIRPTNLVLRPDKGSIEDLVNETKNGILVKGSLIGVHTSNAVTGDFSVTAENAFKIENGTVAYPLKACTVAGNLHEALQSLVAIGNDSRCLGNIVCPSVSMERVVVAT